MVYLDKNGRPTLIAITPALWLLTETFEKWFYDRVGGVNDDVVQPQVGVFSPDVPDDLIWFFLHPMNTKGEVAVLRDLYKVAKIDLGVNSTRQLLAHRQFAFTSEGGGPASYNAAASVDSSAANTLPPLPSGAKMNMKALLDCLFQTMPAFLLLLKCTRVRTPNLRATIEERMVLNGCEQYTGKFETYRCLSCHHWPVAMKDLLISVFMRKLPNYQRAMILFLTFVWCAIGHAKDLFVVVVSSTMEVSLSLSKTGDSWKCTTADLKQEEVVGQVKHVVERDPTAFGMASMRSRVYSLFILRREQASAQNYDPLKTKRSKERNRKEEHNMWAIRRMAHVVQVEIFATGSTVTVADNPSLHINDIRRIFFLYSWVKVNAAAAVCTITRGFRDHLARALPLTTPAAASALHTVVRKKEREEMAADKMTKKKQHDLHVKLMRNRGELDLLEDTSMYSSGKCGDGKAELGIKMLTRYGKVGAPSGVLRRPSFNIFKTPSDLATFLKADVTARSKVVDAVVFFQDRPQPWRDGVPDDITAFARSMIVRMCSGRFYKDGVVIVIMCIDCAVHTTHKRVIQQFKRGKVQLDPAVQNAILDNHGGDTRLGNIGGFAGPGRRPHEEQGGDGATTSG
jgi:hypothetical protein